MENILKGILIGAGIVLTCIVVSIGFRVSRASITVSSNHSNKLDRLSSDINESDLTMYDGLEVNGSDVVNLIKKLLGDYTSGEKAPVSVQVITSKSDSTYINGVAMENISNFTDNKYISPIAIFDCKVVRNKNKVIVTLKFTQK